MCPGCWEPVQTSTPSECKSAEQGNVAVLSRNVFLDRDTHGVRVLHGLVDRRFGLLMEGAHLEDESGVCWFGERRRMDV
jgi:hypothetical protein